MEKSEEKIIKSLKIYSFIGLLLLFGTVATVAVAVVPSLDVGARGFSTGDLIVGLLIASCKASLVMFVFMHLNHEKKLIYLVYGMAGFLAICLFFLTKLAFIDPIHYSGFSTGVPTVEESSNHTN